MARNAHRLGLTRKPWVKTSLAPGSKAVELYLKEAGLLTDLEALGLAHRPIGQVVPWAGLRPMTPSMLPRVGPGARPNVFYNTGHGHLGWTLSAATADMLADMVCAASRARSEIGRASCRERVSSPV